MTNELEKTFFATFGIKPKLVESCTKPRYKCLERFVKDCSKCPRAWRKYPQISDRILLELIVVIMLHEDLYGFPRSVKDLKENVLKQLMETYNKFSSNSYEYQQTARDIKHQICTLFEEGVRCSMMN